VNRVRVGIDFNCSPRLAGALDALYGHKGFQFLHVQTLVEGRTKDETWADVFTKFGGRVVVSGNCKIAYKPHQAVAFIDNGLISFFPEGAWSRLFGHMRNAFLIHAWPRMEEKISAGMYGTCWGIPFRFIDGELRLSSEPLKLLEIPNDILEAARAEKSAAGNKKS
jgi:hypothetical protein